MGASRRACEAAFARVIPADLACVDALCGEARRLLARQGQQDRAFDVELLLRELVNNAILHGSGGDRSKRVSVEARVGRAWITIKVRDEGPGFDWRKALRRAPEDDATSGRGLAIGRRYASRMRFNRAGNEVALWVVKSGGGGGEAMGSHRLERDGASLRVRLGAKLTAVEAPALQVDLKREIGDGARDIVFDLGATVSIDSTGIGLLIAANNSVVAAGGGVRLVEASGDVLRLLSAMRLVERLRASGRDEGRAMDDEILREFVEEAREHLATIEADLLRIEEGGAEIDEQLVNKVFRAAHSIKGGSGFFGLNKVKELAHKAETVLDMIRSRRMPPNAEVVNVLLAAFDRLRDLINRVEESEAADIEDLVAGLSALAASYLPEGRKATLSAAVAVPLPGRADAVELPQVDLERVARDGRSVYWVDCDLAHDVERKGQNVLALFRAIEEAGEILDCAVDFAAVGTLDTPVGNRVPLRLVLASSLEPAHVGELFPTIEPSRIHVLLGASAVRSASAAPPSPAALLPQAPAPEEMEALAAPASIEASPVTAAKAAAPPPPPSSAAVDETLRVHVGLLERLMNLAGELVLSRNQLRAAVARDDRGLLLSADQRINQVTAELQDVIMQTRLQPIGNVFSKFPRVVRDLSRSLGKEIDLDIRGKDVALDKTLIEGLSDPLTHMVRNAVDHGIETAEERTRAGKRKIGAVRIEARHEAGSVVVEIADDGKGISPDAVADAAIRKGLVTAEKVRGLADRDKQALVFLPGLSTARQVSDVSGRGVGMDVVKTNLDRLGGQVEIVSEVGRGSTFRIKLPLTLAIIPSLIVSVENERFAIPQANVEELIRLRPDQVKERVEVVGDAPVLLLRDRVLPLVRFADILGAVPTYPDPCTGRRETDRRLRLADRRSPRREIGEDSTSRAPASPTDAGFQRREGDRRQAASSALEIAVLSTGAMSFALVVGAFHDTEEVVVKPLGSRFKRLREYSGATILGDGAVALILDAGGLAAKAGLASVSGSARAAEIAAEAEATRLQDLHSLLQFHNGEDEPCAIPVELVQRIERIRPEQVERLGAQRTMQYRGGSLPLVTLADVAAVSSTDGARDPVVLVVAARGREVGLLAAMPVDVLEVRATVDSETHRQPGVLGSALIGGRTTLLIDLPGLVDAAKPAWREEARIEADKAPIPAAEAQPGDAAVVLLAEDSDFFRGQVKRFLEEEGFRVLAAPDGEAAWSLLLEEHESVRVVVTDIEMPRLDGLGLAARIRGDARTARLPIIAVTSLASEEDTARGYAAGVNEYQVKLDRDRLVSSVREMARAI